MVGAAGNMKPSSDGSSGGAQASASKANLSGMEVSAPAPPPGQVQSSKAASTAAAGYQGTPRTVSQKSSEVLHQRGNLPVTSPARLVVGGFLAAMALGYFTLYTKKKPEATAIDVAKVATGSASQENTPRP